jgi:hypothetical protein
VVAEDATLDGPAVAATVAPLLADPDRLAAMAEAMRAQAHPAAAEELAALVVEASGRATREQFLAEVAAAAAPVDREATGWFESAGTPAGGPTVQRRVDRRTKRMEAYPPIDRKAHPAGQRGSGAPPPAAADTPTSELFNDPDDPKPEPQVPGRAGDASTNGHARRPSVAPGDDPGGPPDPPGPPGDHPGGPPDPPAASERPPDDQGAGP